MKITELKGRDDFFIHGNKSRSPLAVLRGRFGNTYSTVYVGDRCGTIKDSRGKFWDWFISENTGDVVIVEAK